MSIFPSRRSDDAHEAACARYEEQIELVRSIAIPSWLRGAIERARASRWTVVRSVESIVFDRLDAEEHRYVVRLPLPDASDAVDRIRGELLVRVRSFEQQAA